MNYKIMYLRDKKQQPIGCLAIEVTRTKKHAKYQLSVLNPVDRFDRGLARSIALGRLVENSFTIPLSNELTTHQVSKDVMRHLADNKDVPHRAVRAARRWLAAIPQS